MRTLVPASYQPGTDQKRVAGEEYCPRHGKSAWSHQIHARADPEHSAVKDFNSGQVFRKQTAGHLRSLPLCSNHGSEPYRQIGFDGVVVDLT
jgi:hypothetical protein